MWKYKVFYFHFQCFIIFKGKQILGDTTKTTTVYFPSTDKPDKPTGPIVIEALLKNSVVISWKPPEDDGGSWITNYVVEKCEAKEGAEWQLVSSAISVTTCRIVNLTENAGYYFRVSAQNTFGISDPLEVPSVVIIKSPFGEYNCYNFHMAKFFT